MKNRIVSSRAVRGAILFVSLLSVAMVCTALLMPSADAKAYEILWEGTVDVTFYWGLAYWLEDVGQIKGGEAVRIQLVVSNVSSPTGFFKVRGLLANGTETEEILEVADGVDATYETSNYFVSLGWTSTPNERIFAYKIFHTNLLVRHVAGGAAGAPTIPVELPNVPYWVKEILQRVLDFLSLRHVRAVLALGSIVFVGAVVLKYEKKVNKLGK